MELRELRYFVAVYESGSLTAAARACHVSQPSISAALAALEAELGAPLFVRHRKGAAPTPEAERLYPRARRLTDEAAALPRLFRPDAPASSLTLGLMRTLDIARTMALLAPVAARPDLDLVLVAADEPCDARIVSARDAGPDERFLTLWTEPYVVVLPPQHPLRFKAEIAAHDLAGLKLVNRTHCENAHLLESLGEAPRVVATAGSEDWALALVRAGVGAAIMPRGAAPEAAGVVTRPLADYRIERHVGLAYPRAPTASVRGLIAALARSNPPAAPD